MFYLFAYLLKGECIHISLMEQIFYKWLRDFSHQTSLHIENMVRVRVQKEGLESLKTFDKLQIFRNEFCLHGPFSLFSSIHAYSW